ncbi:MAG: sulfite exporter TauE/SafE family protein [Deltaproteobacteria bacterium]|nr:sulfite exporter TauE/SafE family protein [Deltaproteobacteria bacterium]
MVTTDYSILHIVLLIASGLAAGFINAVSGGGSMLTLPALIFIGIPPGIANGTNRVAVVVQNIAALATYHQLKVTNHRLAFSLAIPTIVGSFLGALVSIRLDDTQFRTILGIVLLLLIGPVLAERQLNARFANRQHTFRESWGLWAVFFFIGVYSGFLQVAAGLFFLLVLNLFGGMNLVLANSVKVTAMLCTTAIALLVFVADNKVVWGTGLLLAAANACGAWLGARWGVKKGEAWIRIVLITTVVGMSLQLLGGFAWVSRVVSALKE